MGGPYIRSTRIQFIAQNAAAHQRRLVMILLIGLAGLTISFSMPRAADMPSGTHDMVSPDRPVSSEAVQTEQLSPLDEGIAGQILDEMGHPIEGTFISVRSASPHGPPIPDLAILSTRSGAYQWRLGPGHYLVSASHIDYLPMQREVLVHTRQVTIANFTLSR